MSSFEERVFSAGAQDLTRLFWGQRGGDECVFLVDLSDSMVEKDKGGIEEYKNFKEKLGQMIQSLAPDTNFNVAFYSDAVDLFMPSSVPATPENNQAAMNFLPRHMAVCS